MNKESLALNGYNKYSVVYLWRKDNRVKKKKNLYNKLGPYSLKLCLHGEV